MIGFNDSAGFILHITYIYNFSLKFCIAVRHKLHAIQVFRYFSTVYGSNFCKLIFVN